MSNQIYILHTSDVWKSYASSDPVWAGTSFAHLYMAIKKRILDKVFTYRDENGPEGAELFQEDMLHDYRMYYNPHEERMRRINTNLDYGYVLSTANNSNL